MFSEGLQALYPDGSSIPTPPARPLLEAPRNAYPATELGRRSGTLNEYLVGLAELKRSVCVCVHI